jgi:hypothetical protein
MTLNTYGHVIAELAEAEKVSAEDLIREAREKIRPISGPQSKEDVSAGTSMNDKTRRNGVHASGRWWTRTTDLFLIRERRSVPAVRPRASLGSGTGTRRADGDSPGQTIRPVSGPRLSAYAPVYSTARSS